MGPTTHLHARVGPTLLLLLLLLTPTALAAHTPVHRLEEEVSQLRERVSGISLRCETFLPDFLCHIPECGYDGEDLETGISIGCFFRNPIATAVRLIVVGVSIPFLYVAGGIRNAFGMVADAIRRVYGWIAGPESFLASLGASATATARLIVDSVTGAHHDLAVAFEPYGLFGSFALFAIDGAFIAGALWAAIAAARGARSLLLQRYTRGFLR